MSAFKNLIIDVVEMLEKTDMDYERVADFFGISPAQVYSIAKMFGDVE